ncbi:MAG: ChaN family lipoprotein [Desulfohalobiaceae bacterium]
MSKFRFVNLNLFLFSLVLLLLCWGCSKLRVADRQFLEEGDVSPGEFLDAQGAQMEKSEILELVRQSEFILLGESHTNPCDHKVQREVMDLVLEADKRLALGLEMVPASKQDILQDFNQGEIDIKDLESALEWQNIWGHDFSLYQPVLEKAQKANVPLYGLNVSQTALQELKEKGLQEMSSQHRQELPRRIIPPSKAQKKSLRSQYKRHEEVLQEETHSLEDEDRFFLVQSVWDTQMAQKALEVHRKTGHRVLILAGSEHVRKDWGIVRRLRILGQDPQILTLVPWRGLNEIDAGQGDILFYCPHIHQSRLGIDLRLEPQGMVVDRVKEDSRAAQAGFMPGDVLLKAGKEEVQDVMDLHSAAMQAQQEQEPLLFEVKRQDSKLMLKLEI